MLLTRPEKKNGRTRWKRWFGFEDRLLSSVLFAGFPAVVLSLVLLWTNSYSLDHKLEATVLIVLLWCGLSVAARDKVVHSVQVLSNVIAAVQHEDFSFRAKGALRGDAFGDLAVEINNLAQALEQERLGATEATTLLRKVMSEADAAIFAFSPDRRLRFVNRAGEAFLAKPAAQLVGCTADELEIADLLDPSPSDTISRTISGVERRWIVRRTHFRQQGVQHGLVLLSEASQALRAEERIAWQRIIRVLGHEINNSLAPIKSIARTLARQSVNQALQEGINDNFRQGLKVIEDRAESLNQFLQSYARLAKLPVPAKRVASLDALVAHVVSLEPRLQVTVEPGPSVQIYIDPGQIEQALINLIKNSVEAVLLTGENKIAPDAVTVSWKVQGNDVELLIRDRGVGLLDTGNLFVPFYTTKQNGTGIGLILSRQIVEAHGGTLALRNCLDHTGCEVQIKLPASVYPKSPAPSVLATPVE
jgi:two-component system nitrogen regulation sensor histidine kinase NtrY